MDIINCKIKLKKKNKTYVKQNSYLPPFLFLLRGFTAIEIKRIFRPPKITAPSSAGFAPKSAYPVLAAVILALLQHLAKQAGRFVASAKGYDSCSHGDHIGSLVFCAPFGL